ncbi:hypothetical protein QYF61_025870 [Mycteria americana]|uniref:Uncharacterized protein n=1 Tax=Mycteria americana TaxID=33587 RepID=A0AAN7SAA1_MYCAM|nr:hypothetical protein QYF61_025870 [Mycteria americana]
MGQNELLLSLQMMKDLDKLEEWSNRSFLKFSKGKCFVLHLEHNSPMQQHRLGTDWLSDCLAEKKLVLMDSKDKVSQQHMVVKGNHFIGLSSEEQGLLRRHGIHLTKQGENIFAKRLSNLTRKTQTHWRDEVQREAGVQAKQPQFPQPLLTRLLLQTLHQLRCPSLDTLQHLNVPLVVGGPKLNTVFEVRPHQCRVQGHNHFPTPAGHAVFDTSQDAIGFLGRLGTLLAHIQAAVNQHPNFPPLVLPIAFQFFSVPLDMPALSVQQEPKAVPKFTYHPHCLFTSSPSDMASGQATEIEVGADSGVSPQTCGLSAVWDHRTKSSIIHFTVATAGPRPPQGLHGCLGAPRGCGWHSSACTDPALRKASGKKGRGICLPCVAERTSKHDGTASKPDSCHAVKCGAALTALEQSLEKSDVAGLGFVFLIPSQLSSTESLKRRDKLGSASPSPRASLHKEGKSQPLPSTARRIGLGLIIHCKSRFQDELMSFLTLDGINSNMVMVEETSAQDRTEMVAFLKTSIHKETNLRRSTSSGLILEYAEKEVQTSWGRAPGFPHAAVLAADDVAKTECSFITLVSTLASVRLNLILEVIKKGKQLIIVHVKQEQAGLEDKGSQEWGEHGRRDSGLIDKITVLQYRSKASRASLLEYSGPRILCIPDSKTVGVNLESLLVLSSRGSRSVRKEGEEMLQVPEQIPLQPLVKTMVRQAVPLQPMDVHSGADIHLQPVEDPTPEQVDA